MKDREQHRSSCRVNTTKVATWCTKLHKRCTGGSSVQSETQYAACLISSHECVYSCSCVCVVILYVFAVLCVHCCFYLHAGLLARSQYSEGPATGHLDTGFSWFPCVYKQMLRWFPRFQVATTCFSCSPPDLNLLVTYFIFCINVK